MCACVRVTFFSSVLRFLCRHVCVLLSARDGDPGTVNYRESLVDASFKQFDIAVRLLNVPLFNFFVVKKRKKTENYI